MNLQHEPPPPLPPQIDDDLDDKFDDLDDKFDDIGNQVDDMFD